jgi:hypothetical protein
VHAADVTLAAMGIPIYAQQYKASLLVHFLGSLNGC